MQDFKVCVPKYGVDDPSGETEIYIELRNYIATKAIDTQSSIE